MMTPASRTIWSSITSLSAPLTLQPSSKQLTRTYGGQRTDKQCEAMARVIDEEFGGSVTKVEDAALYIWRRR